MNAIAPPPDHFAVQGSAHDLATLNRIGDAVEAHYGVPMAHIRGSRRYATVCLPRYVAVYLARKLTALSLHQLGYAFRRDHSTIAQSVGRLRARMATDPALAAVVARIEAKVAEASA
jgi:chromosomal replication initiator protein